MKSTVLVAAAALLVVSSCSRDIAAPVATSDFRISAASSTSGISVVSANPDSAVQDTTLDVTINGSGFATGAVATWLFKGVADPVQVRTNSTRYVTSRKLIANITISASAQIGKWDIAVAAVGKGGIGTEMFAIKIRGNTDTASKANLVWEDMINVAPAGQPENWQPTLLTGDYRSLYGAPLLNGKAGEYQGKFCGSTSYLRNQQMRDGEVALNFDVDHGYDSTTMAIPCGGKRYYQVFFNGRAGSTVRVGPQHYALDLGDYAVGETRLHEVHFGIQQPNCSALHYNDIYAPASNARITRLTDTLTASGTGRRWRVESQGSHQAMCTQFTNKGPKPVAPFYLPFAFTLTEIQYPFARYP